MAHLALADLFEKFGGNAELMKYFPPLKEALKLPREFVVNVSSFWM